MNIKNFFGKLRGLNSLDVLKTKDAPQSTDDDTSVAAQESMNDSSDEAGENVPEDALLRTLSSMTPPHVTWVKDDEEDTFPYVITAPNIEEHNSLSEAT